MAIISLRQLLDHAAEHSYGIPAYNVNNMEQMQAIMQAASATGSPVIVQASAGARSYAGAAFLTPPDRGCGGAISRYTRVCSSGSRYVSCYLSAVDSTGFFIGDDGWVAGIRW